MIQGIEILNVIKTNVYYPGITIIGIVFLIFSILIIAATFYDGDMSIFSVFLLMFTFGVSTISFLTANKIDNYSYEVKISDNVSINDLTEQYEIIEKHGDVYIIQDIDLENRKINIME